MRRVGSPTLAIGLKINLYEHRCEMIRERLQPVIEAGIDYFIVTVPREAYDQDAVRHFARRVIPLFG